MHHNFIRFLISFAFLLPLAVVTSQAQNAVNVSSVALPGGGTGSSSVVIGPSNSYPAASGANFNVFIGNGAGIAITKGGYNSFVGSLAGNKNTDGDYNTFTGAQAGFQNEGGNHNIFTGYRAGFDNTSGSFNIFMGNSAGYRNTSGRFNTFAGYAAGEENRTADHNTFFGYISGNSNRTGRSNSFFGSAAGRDNETGEENTFVGYQAGTNNFSGSHNTFLGRSSGLLNSSGHYNAFLGFEAGRTNTIGDYNSFIGSYSDATGPNKGNLERATALGYKAYVAVDDGLVLGDTTNVKVGIGTAYPNQRLTLRGNINFVAYDNSLRLKNQPFLHFNEHESLALGLGAELPADAENTLVLGGSETEIQLPGVTANYLKNAGQVLTINESGKVLLTKPRIQVQNASDWADKVFEENYALRPLAEVEEFVKKNKHLPGIPSAEKMAAEGMESAAFNAKLLEKIEELTLYVLELKKENEEIKRLIRQNN